MVLTGVKSGGEALARYQQTAVAKYTRSSSMAQLTTLQSVWDGTGVGSKGRARYGGTQGCNCETNRESPEQKTHQRPREAVVL